MKSLPTRTSTPKQDAPKESIWRKEWRSFGFAWRGIATSSRHETHLQFHWIAALLVTSASCLLDINRYEWIAVTLCMVMVLAAELFNTAIEHLTDLVSPDYHLLAQKTKDAAAGAVLVVAIGAIVVGVVVFLPKIWTLFLPFFK
ncbi:MAG: diacylglycerol kinase family protein [Chitinophagales bacterium]|nr:diacylglycerol kinase family protein [Chitinophagales bacterium]